MNRANEPSLDKIKSGLGLPAYLKYRVGDSSVYLVVRNTQLLNDKIVPFFEKFPFFGIKRDEFKIWKEGVAMKYSRKTLTSDGIYEYMLLRNKIHQSDERRRKWDYGEFTKREGKKV